MKFSFFIGDELSDADDEIMENKRFPQQRFSPINPVRARSVTPKRGRYFSPIPVTRPWTPDFKIHHRSLLQSSTDALAKYRSSSTSLQREYSPALSGSKTQSPSMLQSGAKSAFTSIESNRTVPTGEDSKLPSGNAERDLTFSSAEDNNVGKSFPKPSNSDGLLSATLAQPPASWSMPSTLGMTAFQTNPPQIIKHHPTSSSAAAYSNRTVADMSSLEKSTMADAQYGRIIPPFVYTSDGSVRINGGSFNGQALPYHQIPPSSYISPFVALSYPGLHIQDKVMSPFSPHTLPTQLPGSPTGLLRPNPLVNALISPVLNIQVQSSIAAGHSAPPTSSVQNLGEKLATKGKTNSNYQGADTTVKSDEVNKRQSPSSAILPETSTRKDSKTPAQKEGKATKNILKKFVADGMEQ